MLEINLIRDAQNLYTENDTFNERPVMKTNEQRSLSHSGNKRS